MNLKVVVVWWLIEETAAVSQCLQELYKHTRTNAFLISCERSSLPRSIHSAWLKNCSRLEAIQFISIDKCHIDISLQDKTLRFIVHSWPWKQLFRTLKIRKNISPPDVFTYRSGVFPSYHWICRCLKLKKILSMFIIDIGNQTPWEK